MLYDNIPWNIPTFNSHIRIFHWILTVPHNIVIDLNNIMETNASRRSLKSNKQDGWPIYMQGRKSNHEICLILALHLGPSWQQAYGFIRIRIRIRSIHSTYSPPARIPLRTTHRGLGWRQMPSDPRSEGWYRLSWDAFKSQRLLVSGGASFGDPLALFELCPLRQPPPKPLAGLRPPPPRPPGPRSNLPFKPSAGSPPALAGG